MDDRSHRNHIESLSIESIRKGAQWIVFDDNQKHFTKGIATLGRECREWTERETNEAVKAIIAKIFTPWDAVFTNGSVKRGMKS